MEDLNPGFADSRLKRKCQDGDAMAELFEHVRLSPSSKRLRQDSGSTSNNTEFPNQLFVGSDLPCPPVDLELADIPTTDVTPDIELSDHGSEPLPVNQVNEERAIVLYKPVNSPLLLGGPYSGLQFLANSMVLPSGILDASSHFMHNGNVAKLPCLQSIRKGDRVSSDAEVVQGLTRKPDFVQDDRLAVVPWVSTTVNMAHSPITMEGLKRERDDMCVEGVDVKDVEYDDVFGHGSCPPSI